MRRSFRKKFCGAEDFFVFFFAFSFFYVLVYRRVAGISEPLSSMILDQRYSVPRFAPASSDFAPLSNPLIIEAKAKERKAKGKEGKGKGREREGKKRKAPAEWIPKRMFKRTPEQVGWYRRRPTPPPEFSMWPIPPPHAPHGGMVTDWALKLGV